VPSCFVIFGARLHPDGRPGPALTRRVVGAVAAASGQPDARFLVTGAQPRGGRTEAAVIRELLHKAGIHDSRILVEDAAHNTRASAILCAAILRNHPGLSPVLVCSDRFHQARCAMLLRACGIAARAAPMANERAAMRWQLWLFYRLRELAALPYDALMIALRRR
jgi:uncharacterized SAM-binding protein YcdF (DUF218 family)